ncbi:MAG: ribokinase [Anaerolineales bacterium]|nr:ribokinase [Anaerolineales bacterium]
MTNHIVVVGSINIDHVVRLARLPKPGETIRGENYQTFFGGKGANQAIAAARCGAPVMMLGNLGEDDAGRAAKKNLEVNGVDTYWIVNDPQTTTGMAMILVEEAGQNMIAVVGGANMRLSPQHIEESADLFREARLIIVQLEIPLETVSAAVSFARKTGAHVVLNPSPGQILPDSVLTRVDSLVLNETELALIEGDSSIEVSAGKLTQRSGARVIVTLGGEGAAICAPDHALEYLPSHNVKVVDTVGAGDAFVGAYAAAVVEGKPFAEAVAWGNAAGALAVTKMGAQSALPLRDDVMHLIREMPAKKG